MAYTKIRKEVKENIKDAIDDLKSASEKLFIASDELVLNHKHKYGLSQASSDIDDIIKILEKIK